MTRILEGIFILMAIIIFSLLFILVMSVETGVIFVLLSSIGFILASLVVVNYAFYLTLKLSDRDSLKLKFKQKYHEEGNFDKILTRQKTISQQLELFDIVIGILMLLLILFIIRVAFDFGFLYLLLLAVPLYFINALGLIDYHSNDFRQGFYLNPEKYPKIYEILDEVKEKLECYERIDIYVIYGKTASVSYRNGSYIIVICATFLATLTKDELKCVFFHEIGHIINGDSRMLSEISDLVAKLQRTIFHKSFFLANYLTFAMRIYFATELSVLSVAPSKEQERMADLAVKQAGLGKVHISGLLKIEYWDHFDSLYETKYKLAQDRIATSNIIQEEVAQYIENVAVNKERYNKFIANGLSSYSQTHPSVIERMEAMGVMDFDCLAFEPYDEAELSKILIPINYYLTDEKKYRKRHNDYNERISIIYQYESKKVIDETKMYQYANALWRIGENIKSYHAVCEMLKHFPNNPRANILLGKLKILLYDDPSGIDDIINFVEGRFSLSDSLIDALNAMMRLGFEKRYLASKDRFEEIIEFNDDNDEYLCVIDKDTFLEEVRIDKWLEAKIIELLQKNKAESLYIVRKWIDNYHIDLICVSFDDDSVQVNRTLEELYQILENQTTEFAIHVIGDSSIAYIKEFSKPLLEISE